MTQIVILAGGLATRLGDRCASAPKSMVSCGGQPFIRHQLVRLRAAGFTEAVLCLGHLWEQIAAYVEANPLPGMDVRLSVEPERLGTGGALCNALEFLHEEFCVTYGDSYLFLDGGTVRQRHIESGKPALMVVTRHGDRRHARNVAVRRGLVADYGKGGGPGRAYLDYGMIAMRRDVLAAATYARRHDLGVLFSDLARRRQLVACPTDAAFFEIGSEAGIAEFERYLVESCSGLCGQK